MSNVHMQPVSSSNIAAIGWAEDMLYVEFKGGRRYVYEGVPETEFNALMKADSQGQYLNANIKPGYNVTEV